MPMEWKPKGKPKLVAFKEFELKGGEVIGVFQGSKGSKPDLDIIVMYKDKFTKSVPRKPKHINWVIDLLIKKEHNKQLTLDFIKFVLGRQHAKEPLQKICKIDLRQTALKIST